MILGLSELKKESFLVYAICITYIGTDEKKYEAYACLPGRIDPLKPLMIFLNEVDAMYKLDCIYATSGLNIIESEVSVVDLEEDGIVDKLAFVSRGLVVAIVEYADNREEEYTYVALSK